MVMRRRAVAILVSALLILPWPWPDVLRPDVPWSDVPIQEAVTLGWASQYAGGVMERVVRFRQDQGQLPRPLFGYDGAVAARDCDDIGKAVWLRPVGAEDFERFIVADCASRVDSRWQDGLSGWEWMLKLDVLVEVDRQTAGRWGCVGRLIRVEMK